MEWSADDAERLPGRPNYRSRARRLGGQPTLHFAGASARLSVWGDHVISRIIEERRSGGGDKWKRRGEGVRAGGVSPRTTYMPCNLT